MLKKRITSSVGEEKFYLQCSEMLLALAAGIARQRPDVQPKDLAQDVMVNILRIGLFDRVMSASECFNVEGYLYAAVRFRYLEILKTKRSADFPAGTVHLSEQNGEQPNLEALITEFMDKNPHHREKVEATLKIYLEGKSYEEVASEYHVNRNLLYQWIWRAKVHLAEFLSSKGVHPGVFSE